jgi:hypothetical protein
MLQSYSRNCEDTELHLKAKKKKKNKVYPTMSEHNDKVTRIQ